MLETEKFKVSDIWQLGSNNRGKWVDPGIDVHLSGVCSRTWQVHPRYRLAFKAQCLYPRSNTWFVLDLLGEPAHVFSVPDYDFAINEGESGCSPR